LDPVATLGDCADVLQDAGPPCCKCANVVASIDAFRCNRHCHAVAIIAIFGGHASHQ